jgi:hypothetical protein
MGIRMERRRMGVIRGTRRKRGGKVLLSEEKKEE